MKLVERKDSPFWCGYIHVGWTAAGRKRYTLRSSKVRIDAQALDSRGRRADRARALEYLEALQRVADKAMRWESDRVDRETVRRSVEDVWRACGLTIGTAPVWQDFAGRFVESYRRKRRARSTVAQYESHCGMFGRWIGSETRLDDVPTVTIQDWYDDRIDSGARAGTANNSLKTVRRVFQRAVDWGELERNPAAAVCKLDNAPVSKSAFSVDEVARIWAVLSRADCPVEFSGQWRRMVFFASLTGARQVDCKGLRWDDFGDGFGSVDFSQQKTGGDVVLLLPDWAGDFLAGECDQQGNDPVFLCPDLRRIRASRRGLGARFREILDLAGVDNAATAPAGPGGITQYAKGFHSFRSFVSSELDADGVSEATNRLVTGHEDVKEKRKYIQKSAPAVFAEMRGTMDRVGGALGF